MSLLLSSSRSLASSTNVFHSKGGYLYPSSFMNSLDKYFTDASQSSSLYPDLIFRGLPYLIQASTISVRSSRLPCPGPCFALFLMYLNIFFEFTAPPALNRNVRLSSTQRKHNSSSFLPFTDDLRCFILSKGQVFKSHNDKLYNELLLDESSFRR